MREIETVHAHMHCICISFKPYPCVTSHPILSYPITTTTKHTQNPDTPAGTEPTVEQILEYNKMSRQFARDIILKNLPTPDMPLRKALDATSSVGANMLMRRQQVCWGGMMVVLGVGVLGGGSVMG